MRKTNSKNKEIQPKNPLFGSVRGKGGVENLNPPEGISETFTKLACQISTT